MVLHLAEHLAVPLRDRNMLLVAAGYAPIYSETSLDDPGLKAARSAVELILKAHEPFPALAVDRHWTLVSANRAVPLLLSGVGAAVLQPPVNVLRLSLHPEGLAPRIGNFREWRGHVLARLVQQIENTADPVLIRLLEELKSYPAPAGARPHRAGGADALAGIAVPLQLLTGERDALVLEPHQRFWNGGRHHARGARHRVVSAGRLNDRRFHAAALAGDRSDLRRTAPEAAHWLFARPISFARRRALSNEEGARGPLPMVRFRYSD